MSLPTTEILQDIDKLITEITGFHENDENFAICQRYCLSHVIHHTYPCVNKTDVKYSIDNYISRYYGHGYFKVSQELNNQVEIFLSNEKLFQKNPQYDIQWCLLNLVCLLSANLTAMKSIPELLSTDNNEIKLEDINWKEYLLNDKQLQCCEESSGSETGSIVDKENDGSAVSAISKEETNDVKTSIGIEDDNSIKNNDFTNAQKSELRKEIIKKILNSKNFSINLEHDLKLRGNISEKFDMLMNAEGIYRKSQYLSEYQFMEYILHQFLTGERVFLKKGIHSPALLSITQDTLSNYLASIQPYFKITRSFLDFDAEILEFKFPEKFQRRSYNSVQSLQGSLLTFNAKRQKIPNVLYTYNVMLQKALESFQNDLLRIADDLQSFTLIRMERKLQPHFRRLKSLFRVHSLATQNWKKSSNWMCSVRILSVLYHAITDAATKSDSFLFMNLFLHCFKVYLDIIDSWISSLHLYDPNEEFILTQSNTQNKSIEFNGQFQIRPYLKEMDKEGLKKVPVLDFIAEKMIHVGESLLILKRLGRYASTSTTNSFQEIIKNLNEQISSLGKLKPISKLEVQEKKKSIFTLSNINLNLRTDCGGGDFFENENNQRELQKVKEENIGDSLNVNESKCVNEDCLNFIKSTIKNPYFKMAFSNMGIKSTLKKLEAAKIRKEENLALMIIQKSDDKICTFYPFHKLIIETCVRILEGLVFNTCVLVKNIVLTEFHLQEHLSLLKNVFFFNESYLIQSFVINLFTQPSIWRNSYSLTLHLKECVESRYKNLTSPFLISIEKNCLTSNINILNVIDAITINYEVTWPLTLIFPPDVMLKYNKVFRFALKLKWAHWLLCNLHFESSKNKYFALLNSNTRHRLQLLKFWILSTLNRIENYFMSNLTCSDKDLSCYSDLKDIINAHSNFIDKIYTNCLLSERVPDMGILILKILIPLCMEIEQIFLHNCDNVEIKLSSIETRFGNCHLQLCNILSSLEME